MRNIFEDILNKIFTDYISLGKRVIELSSDTDFIQFTTVKVEDVHKTFEAMREVVQNCLEHAFELSYIQIVEHKPELLASIIEIARRHHYRGVTLELFMSCWKVIVHAIEEKINGLTGYSVDQIIHLQRFVRKVYDACETLFLKEWVNIRIDILQEELMKSNREITLAKNKYQNVFDGTSDLIIITDENGNILEMNASAKLYFEKYLDKSELCV